MTAISRMRVAWAGFPGAPGVSTFYSLDAPAMFDALHAFFNSVKVSLPADVALTVEPSGDIIEDTDGTLIGGWSTTGAAIINGADGGIYAAPAGATINWFTAGVLDGHRVRGRTFLVPIGAASYATDGTLNSTNLATFQAAAETLAAAAAATFVVWHRPFLGSPATLTRPARPAHPGGHALVTSATCSDSTAVLRSRRD